MRSSRYEQLNDSGILRLVGRRDEESEGADPRRERVEDHSEEEEGKNLLEIPVTAGAVGILLAPWLAAVGVIAALARHCTIVVVRNPKVVTKPVAVV